MYKGEILAKWEHRILRKSLKLDKDVIFGSDKGFGVIRQVVSEGLCLSGY